MTQHNIIIFTDLDGCLLDHNDYSFTSAKPLLEKLKQYDIPLIINSSKTQLELEIIQKKIGIDTPYIIENGAAVIFNFTENTGHFNIDKNSLGQFGSNRIKKFALLREELLFIANNIKEQYKFKYKGFNDMTLSQISEFTHLSREDAFAASQRTFSEPIIWQDSQSRLRKFKH
ncbi:MAG: HAD hydrolase family protein, partial [Gammaproteobacteria bacterium]|nr:HAD hydrolase family protein [Gammaproteobacteria bacterium]